MRLQKAGISETTIADILWHSNGSITRHYTLAQVRELRDALERTKDKRGASTNRTLRSLAQEARDMAKG